MSKVNFFTTLSSYLDDKESIDLKVQKTGLDLTVLLVPKIKGKTATIVLSGTAEELDEEFFSELSKPVEKIKGLVSNADEVKIEDAEEEEEEESEDDKKEKAEIKELAKKTATKKAEIKELAKKTATKKVEKDKLKVEEPVAETKTEGEINPEGKSTEAIEEEIQKQRIEDEVAAKEAADKVAQEKAEKEAEEKRKAEEAARLQEAFDLAIKNGDEAFEARKYEDAEESYKAATILFTDHKAAKEKYEKANKWVKQLIAAGIIVREEVSNVNG
jgi:PRTRC genetic system protein E